MSSLSSTSTDQEVWASYDDNASYEEDSNAAKARAFITACRILLQRRPKQANYGGRQTGTELEFDPTVYEREQEAAREWLATQAAVTAGGAGVIFGDFTNFRD